LIDFHTHTLFSDGELIPADLVRRCETKRFRAVVITDHVDENTVDFVTPRVVRVAQTLAGRTSIAVFGGVELTNVPPAEMKRMTDRARRCGAQVVLAHGETIVERVAPGTNRAAIEAGVDVLAHPGLIRLQDAREAGRRGVFLEISARKGHSLANGHVARIANEAKASLLFGSDGHGPGDLVTLEEALAILVGTGMDRSGAEQVFRDAERKLRLPEMVVA